MKPRYEEETERRGWFSRLHLSWPMLFLIGWLLYELTTKPTLGAVAVCLKFGWEDFRSAIWLRRNDPRRLRGRACFWLYLASGLAKTAGVAGLMSFAFVAVSPKGPAAQGPRWAAIMEMAAWTGLATLAGLACAVLTFNYAAVLARWGGFKLWLGRDIHAARRRNDWPPYGGSAIYKNYLNYLLLVALLLLFLTPVLFAFLLAAAAQLFGLFVPVFFFLMMGVPLLVLHLKDRMSKWLVASHPGECWDLDTELPSEAESVADLLANPIK
jgi:hypothetical protein